MQFVDFVTIQVQSGSGGNGVVSFRREKYSPKGGPDGGDGGRGGHVVLQANSQMQTLMDLKVKSLFKAKHGNSGRSKNKHGANGQDLVIQIPCGTQVHCDGKLLADLIDHQQKIVVSKFVYLHSFNPENEVEVVRRSGFSLLIFKIEGCWFVT